MHCNPAACIVVLLCALPASATAEAVDRKPYEAVVAQHFPGFEILKPEQFQTGWRNEVRDGENGSLTVGRFNFDAYTDFAAYVAPVGAAAGSVMGKYIECFGAGNGKYECEEQSWPLDLPFEANLLLVPAGVHECYEGEELHKIRVTSESDSIGRYSEKGGGFTIRHKDGSEFICVDSD